MSRLTGRTRYRRGWFGRLILQVEFETPRVSPMHDRLHWRDARADDFASPHIRKIFSPAPLPYPGMKPYTPPRPTKR